MFDGKIVFLLMPWRSSSFFVIGCPVDPTLSCAFFYQSFGLLTWLAMINM